MQYWKCPECEDETSFKGLCRDCTEYDEGGSVVSPIPRERVNADGSPYEKIERRMEPMEMAQMRAKFIEQRRRQLTKRQRSLVEAEAKALREAQSEVAEEAGEDGLLEIGEDVSEEE